MMQMALLTDTTKVYVLARLSTTSIVASLSLLYLLLDRYHT
jgi:hypothetical protein